MSVFNGEAYLSKTVDSILDQTFSDFRFVIVDDGSTDNTWEILNSYRNKDPRIILIRNQPNNGVVRALNIGLEEASGEFIARQDADDISLPQRLEKQLTYLEEHPDCGLVGTVPMLIDVDGNQLGHGLFTVYEDNDIQEKLLDYMCICGPSIVVRRRSFEAAGFYFSEGLDASEDYDLCLRLAEVSKLANLRESLYLYLQHPNSASRKKEGQQIFHKAIALERAVYRRFGSNPDSKRFENVARDFLVASIIAFSQKDTNLASRSFERVMERSPNILEREDLIEKYVRIYTPDLSFEAALDFRESIFTDLFPSTRRLSNLKSHLISDLYMREVFAQARKNNYSSIHPNIWLGIKNNPAWLFNQGVISILFKSILRQD
jgi:glycosyltransferase involved in cell wall biosynthesis